MKYPSRSALCEIAKAAAFLLLLIALLFSFFSFFSFKFDDGLYNMKLFYEQEENSIDVLLLGSSHAYQHIHTGLLYDEFGLASFHLSSGAQHLWTSYHHLKDALKTQKPDLVVLEGYMLAATKDYRLEAWDVRNTFGLRPSLNWVQNLKAAVPEDEFWDFFFRFSRYHTRYEGDLGPQDYYPNKGEKLYEDWKGYLPNFQHTRFDVPDALGTSDTQPLLPDVERYFRMFIELCQAENIPVYIVISPCNISIEELQRCNRAHEIAAEYGVPFVNFNTPDLLEQLKFDYTADLGAGNHLNYRASARFTRALGEMLTAAYDLPDRRGDPRYASWARSSAYHAREFDNQALREETQLAPYLARIASDPDYTAVISVTGYCAPYYEQIVSLLAPLGVEDVYSDYYLNGTWAVRGGEVVARYSPDMPHPYIQLDDHTVTFGDTHIPTLDRTPVSLTARGLNIVVYDHLTQTVADTAGFDALHGFAAVR